MPCKKSVFFTLTNFLWKFVSFFSFHKILFKSRYFSLYKFLFFLLLQVRDRSRYFVWIFSVQNQSFFTKWHLCQKSVFLYFTICFPFCSDWCFLGTRCERGKSYTNTRSWILLWLLKLWNRTEPHKKISDRAYLWWTLTKKFTQDWMSLLTPFVLHCAHLK